MGHLIPMNLQLNAEVGDKGVVKGDIVHSSREEGGWSPGEMASLQCEWAAVSWGEQGLSFGSLSCSAGPSHKGQLDSHLASSGRDGSGGWEGRSGVLNPVLANLPGPLAKRSLWEREWGRC